MSFLYHPAKANITHCLRAKQHASENANLGSTNIEAFQQRSGKKVMTNKTKRNRYAGEQIAPKRFIALEKRKPKWMI